ncbi:MAG: NUDIX domain-containing protein [Chloroflexota bacterium]
MNQEPKVGVAVIVTRNDKVLLVKRKGVHGEGSWSTPGGHLDFGESLESCAKREAKEEVGLDVINIRFRAITNDVFESYGKHYISIWMDGESLNGDPVIAADYEIAELGWFAWDSLPAPLFLPFANLLQGNSYPPQ